jgi:hypothetical protein
MELSRVTLIGLLSACCVLSFACGSYNECQAIEIGTDGGSTPTPICATTGTTVQACCRASHAIGNTDDKGQCKYIVDAPDGGAAVSNLPRVFECRNGFDCAAAAQAVRDFCAASP